MTSRAPSVKARKKSAFSCDACRRRKVRCDGGEPTCGRCLAREDECIYQLSPTLSYTHKLEERIKHLESVISSAGLGDESSPSPACNSAMASEGTPPSLPLTRNSHVAPHGTLANQRLLSDDMATTFFGQPRNPSVEHASPAQSWPQDDSQRRERLVQQAWTQRGLEGLAATPEPFQYMLDSHWSWIQPLFNFIYRPAFTRDMHELGPYYSHALLNALLAHSSRWCRGDPNIRSLLEPYEDGHLFARHARAILFEEISLGKCGIPTVQTLLLLSAHECGAGNRTSAWLYSGMAFRLIEDLGICVDNGRYTPHVAKSDEDLEIRNRLFWSCYFWDKMISLYLGRCPSLQQSEVSPPQVLFDDSAENEVWVPHGLIDASGCQLQYPAVQARSVSCFVQMCRLSVIFNQILLHMYNSRDQNSVSEIHACLIQQGEELDIWWRQLPDYLKMDANDLPLLSPPSHIVTLNCLFHTFRILLFRRALVVPEMLPDHGGHLDAWLKECLGSATSITGIFDLFRRTFGDSRIVLSQAYCVYTAASVFLLKIQATMDSRPIVLARLAFCVDVLAKIKSSTPVLSNAVEIILKSASKAGTDVAAYLKSVASTAARSLDKSDNTGPGDWQVLGERSTTFQSEQLEAFGSHSNQNFMLDLNASVTDLTVFRNLEPITPSVAALDSSVW